MYRAAITAGVLEWNKAFEEDRHQGRDPGPRCQPA
jgi:hypothetical protein